MSQCGKPVEQTVQVSDMNGCQCLHHLCQTHTSREVHSTLTIPGIEVLTHHVLLAIAYMYMSLHLFQYLALHCTLEEPPITHCTHSHTCNIGAKK